MPNLKELFDSTLDEGFTVTLSPKTQKELEGLNSDVNITKESFKQWLQNKIKEAKLGVQYIKNFLFSIKDFAFRKPLNRLAKIIDSLQPQELQVESVEEVEEKKEI